MAKDTFEMKAEVTETGMEGRIRAELLSQMRTILHKKKLDYVQFYVIFTESILSDSKTGKKKLIIPMSECMTSHAQNAVNS